MINGIGYAQGLVSRPVGVVDASARTVLRRFDQSVSGLKGTSSERQAGINLDEGRQALAAAVKGADTIIDQLSQLGEKVALAQGLTVPSKRGDTNLFSLQAETNQLLRSIDDVVSGAASAGVNLIGTPSSNVRISSPNGTVAVTVQPLTSQDLGLVGLDLTTFDGIEQAVATVRAAATTANSRRELLASVADELGNSQRFTARLAVSLRGLSVGATGSDLRVGTALDIRA